MTLREAIVNVIADIGIDKIYKLINKKDRKSAVKCDRPTLEQTREAYDKVIVELINKPRAKAYSMHWLLKESIDPFDKKPYADVCFLNPKYVAPPKGTKPWGGKNAPKGHYNCNLNKYNRTFAAGWTPWSKIIDTPIVNEANYPLEKVVAEILWEMTFYGWTEEKVNTNVKAITGKIKESVKEVKEGKCIEIPPSKEGGYKIVIPNSISKEISDISKKLK